MKKILFPITVFALIMSACQKEKNLPNSQVKDSSLTPKTESSNRYVAGEYIVQLQSGYFAPYLNGVTDYASKIQAASVAVKALLTPLTDSKTIQVQRLYVTALNGFSAVLSPAQVDQLSKVPGVTAIEKNFVISLEMPSTTTNTISQNRAQQPVQYGVARTGYGDGTGKRAWIIDSGIDLDHDDLNVNTALGKDFTADGGLFGGSGGGLFGGGGGLFGGGGGLFGGGGGTPAPQGEDDNGHGTHCAGIVAAIDNEIGVVGVAANAEVVAVKCFNFLGQGNGDDVLQGIDYVASVGAAGEAVNMSFSFAFGSAAVDNATLNLAAQGIFVACAAGNDSANSANVSPARVNGPNVYTISAMDSQDNFASFSNFGNPPVDFCAPGVDIYSTYSNNGYSTLSGTSMATPHVVGLLLLTNGNLNTSGFVNNDPDGNADPIAHL